MPKKLDTQIFSTEFLDRLSRLRLLIKRKSHGHREGGFSSHKGGTGMEFLGFHPYSFGEDIKQVDWHIYARSQELFTRKYAQERAQIVWILVDGSLSMGQGEPNKFSLATQVSAGLAYVALHSGHVVKFGILGEGGIHYSHNFYRRDQFQDICFFLSEFVPQGSLDFHTIFSQFTPPVRCSLFFCSDLLAIESSVLKQFVGKGHELSVLHLLSAEEISPTLHGRVCLVDVETNRRLEFTIEEETLRRFRLLVESCKKRWQHFCRQHRIRYYFTSNLSTMEEIIVNGLYRERWFA